jgi:hypothetical protein
VTPPRSPQASRISSRSISKAWSQSIRSMASSSAWLVSVCCPGGEFDLETLVDMFSSQIKRALDATLAQLLPNPVPHRRGRPSARGAPCRAGTHSRSNSVRRRAGQACRHRCGKQQAKGPTIRPKLIMRRPGPYPPRGAPLTHTSGRRIGAVEGGTITPAAPSPRRACASSIGKGNTIVEPRSLAMSNNVPR